MNKASKTCPKMKAEVPKIFNLHNKLKTVNKYGSGSTISFFCACNDQSRLGF